MLRVNTPRLSGFLHCAATLTLVWACSSDDKTPTVAAGGDANTDAGAPSEAGAAGKPPSTGGSSNPMAGAPAGGEPSAAGAGGAQGAGGEPAKPECVEPGDCVAPETNPAGCAEAQCNEGKCEFLAPDADGDGFVAKRCLSLDPAIVIPTGDDCDDADETVNPDGWDGPEGDGHDDACNDQIDQDCSGVVDDAVLQNDATCTCAPDDTEACSTLPNGTPIDFPYLDGQGKPVGECRIGSRECGPTGKWGPCTDAIAPVDESCDELDNDCDSLVDEEALDRKPYFCDGDSDHHLLAGSAMLLSCSLPTGGCAGGTWRENPNVALFNDCDDANDDRYPDNTERCDGVDQDCDGLVDEKGSVEGGLKTSYYCDADGDTYLAQGTTASQSCATPQGGCTGNWRTVPPGEPYDCNDGDGDKFPTNLEQCDNRDEDCDGLVDEVGPTADGLKTGYYCDADSDGHLLALAPKVLACSVPATGCAGAWRTNPAAGVFNDCDDAAPNNYGGNTEVCDDLDNDCDGLVDEKAAVANGLKATFYHDVDGDGYGVTSTALLACTPPNNTWIDAKGDCSDDVNSDPDAFDINPSGNEVCDGKDDDCDGKTDSADADQEPAPNGPGATYSCQGASGWSISSCSNGVLHCDSNVVNGCETDGTTVSNCRSCGNVCALSCSTSDCDELATLELGAAHSCGVTNAGRGVCWGRNDDGRLGDSTKTERYAPKTVSIVAGFTRISASYDHSCGLAAAGAAYCWGNNASRKGGAPAATASMTEPTALANPDGAGTLTGATSIAAGSEHGCAVYGGGKVSCWGLQAADGRLGNGVTSGTAVGPVPAFRNPPPATPTKIDNATEIVAGWAHTCIINSAGSVECWGDNSSGQLGDGSVANGVAAVDVVGLTNVTAISAGTAHTCAISGASLYCWGANDKSQLGPNGSGNAFPSASYSSPQLVGVSNVTAVAAGGSFTCAIAGGQVKCWGYNSKGQRGDTNYGTSTHVPTTLALTGITGIGAGAEHACALKRDAPVGKNDPVYCWGSNSFGQLGIGSKDSNNHGAPLNLQPLGG